ncbi:MAG: double-strand break repair helicase AddA [Paracoccaceae bacterium]|nr:double-strand break repair helicase AddA [Paracoccaceae bacterium]
MTNEATRSQIEAARPDASTWLAANAGSGKTRVLTNRVARLLLRGVNPQNILCLTYTKAAASEMQNKLFQTLGHWAMLADGDLRKELARLGEPHVSDPRKARTLFASAVEAPGGLKIQTIHSLCSAILRQFPLEAGVSPQFQELDEAGQALLLESVLSSMARSDPKFMRHVASVTGDGLVGLAQGVVAKADSYRTVRTKTEVFALFSVPPHQSMEAITQAAISADDIAYLKTLSPILKTGKTTDQKLAASLDQLPDVPSKSVLRTVEKLFLGQSGKFKDRPKLIPTTDLREGPEFAPLLGQLVQIMESVAEGRRARLALQAAEDTLILQEFAAAFLPRYEAEKQARGVLDFDDLIRKTRQLLTTRSLEWVLYRLDGRIEHILVDEAQDTSPAQWDVIEALAEEMAAGQGDRERSLFVVGDKKQSIYSFQGADAAGFDSRGLRFREQLSGGQGMVEGELLHSFRSSPAILTTVDAIFSGNTTSGTGADVSHKAFFEDMPGRVDLWPIIERPEKEARLPWHDTSYRTDRNHATVQLADKIAKNIKDLLDSGTIPDKKGKWRRVVPGDILVLVQRRSALFDRIIAACKGKKLEIAGADRLKIGSELAVRDILALLSFLALPEDSLSLAAALRSPLFGWSEQQLFTLAAHRTANSFLWQALRDRRAEFSETHAALEDLRRNVDYLRPFELIDIILTKHQGREKLLSRLGSEAEDGIDELLNQAIAYEQSNVPSLTGFLSVAQSSDVQIKREADTSGNLIRVMTVHGAKGLESPIVILPDTTAKPRQTRRALIPGPDGVPVMPRRKGECPPEILQAQTGNDEADEAERDRLLYVAMTRAEKWLIVCGVESGNSGGYVNWHSKVRTGLEALGAQEIDTPTGTGLRYAHQAWVTIPDAAKDKDKTDGLPVLPTFGDPPQAPEPVEIIAPSDLGGAKVLDGGALSEEDAKRKGRQIHLLLEHLPNAEGPENMAKRLLSTGAVAADPLEIPSLLSEARSILRRFPELFQENSMAEVDIVGPSPTMDARVFGTIDRLIVEPDRVFAVDYKTNANVPERVEDVPEGLLRQMGAYLEALEALYPDRPIEIAILWTAAATLMPLPHGIVRDALRRTATS